MNAREVVLEVEGGDIELQVFEGAAPRVASYFLGLARAGFYDGSSFYRSTRLGVEGGPSLIQGGPLGSLLAPAPGSAAPSAMPKFLESFETTQDTGLCHEEGTLSLARDLLDTGHVIPELFLCLGRFPQLDFGGRGEPDVRGFPAFGRVSAGIELVRAIAEGPTAGGTPVEMLRGEILSEQVKIHRVLA